MKDKILDVISPIKFKGTLLIPVKADILKLFGTDQIQFQIAIKNKKLVLETLDLLKSQDFQDISLPQENLYVK